uniref:TATA-box binding protein associated factor, RNA polymerase I subunit A n=1 Tax=Falco tinnunculus TaxID=100819 RepID=A0A8C4XSP5_FALTI
MDSSLEEEEEEEEEEEVAARSPAAQARRALLPGLHLPFLPPQFYRPASSHEHKLNFKKSKEACLNYIQDAILQKQWKRAAEFMTSYVESLEKDYSREYVGPSEVCLEHAFHLLCNGLTDEAYQNLCLAESWRFGEQRVIQDKEIKLIQAYRGLLDYYSWSKQKSIVLEHGQDGFEDLSVEQEMHSCFRKAAVNLKEIIEIPGVWDQFVKCYVDLLEFYGDHNEARQVLNEYAYNSKFPANPNAHVYLYQFLKRHGESKKSLISALKILYDIVPSHELMIDFNIMLQKSKKRKKRQLGLEVIFSALDYAGWKENVKAWSCLARQVKQIVISEKHLDWIKQEWKSRKDWWPAFHFSRYLAKRNWQENESLSYEKALVAGILLGKDCKYFKYVSHQGCKAQVERFRFLKKFVNKHNPVHLRISGLSDSSLQS